MNSEYIFCSHSCNQGGNYNYHQPSHQIFSDMNCYFLNYPLNFQYEILKKMLKTPRVVFHVLHRFIHLGSGLGLHFRMFWY